MGDLLVVGIGDHRAERLPRGVPDEQHRVPVVAVGGDERRGAVADVDDVGTHLREVRGDRLGVPLTALRSPFGVAQQVEHHHGTSGVLPQEALEVGTWLGRRAAHLAVGMGGLAAMPVTARGPALATATIAAGSAAEQLTVLAGRGSQAMSGEVVVITGAVQASHRR